MKLWALDLSLNFKLYPFSFSTHFLKKNAASECCFFFLKKPLPAFLEFCLYISHAEVIPYFVNQYFPLSPLSGDVTIVIPYFCAMEYKG